jgi:hypothetical protein
LILHSLPQSINMPPFTSSVVPVIQFEDGEQLRRFIGEPAQERIETLSIRDAQRMVGCCIAIFERHPGWQRDLALSHGRVAMILSRQGERERALAAFREGREIIVKLKAASPSNATLPKDLSWFGGRIPRWR